MGNDKQIAFYDLPIVARLLNYLTYPAVVLRVSDSKVIIEAANNQFIEVTGFKSQNIHQISLDEIYRCKEEAGEIIGSVLRCAEEKQGSAEKVFLGLKSGTEIINIFNIENSFLYRQQGDVFVLHALALLNENKASALNNKPECIEGFAVVKKQERNREEMLSGSEKRFRALVHDGSDMIAILDTAGNYTYVSSSVKSVLNYPPEFFIGRNAFEFIHPQDRDKANTEFADAKGKRKVSLSPFRFSHSNGSWRWVETIVTDLTSTPSVNGFVANSRDVTDLIEAKMAMELSNERYRYVGKATSDAVWDCDISNGTIFWGEGFLKLFGYGQETLNSDLRTWESRVHEKDLPRVKTKLQAFLCSSDTNWNDEYRFRKSDGTFAYVLDKAFIIRNELGDPMRLIGAMQDITSKKQEDFRLRIMESVVTNTIDSVLVAKIIHDQDFLTEIIFANTAFELMTGYSMKEIEGKSPWFLLGLRSERAELARLLDCTKNNRSYKGEMMNYRKDGRAICVNYSVTPVADQQGEYTHWIAILRDITSEKQIGSQAALLSKVTHAFNKDQGLKSAAIEALRKISDFGSFSYCGLWIRDDMRDDLESLGECFGERNIKKSLVAQWPVALLKQYVTQVKDRGEGLEWNIESIVNANESLLKKLSGFPLFHHNHLMGVLLVGLAKIDEETLNVLPASLGRHLGAELHRKKLEQELNQIFRLAPDVIAITDFKGNFKKLNPAASKILGYSMDQLLARPVADFLHPLEREQTMTELAKLRKAGDRYSIEERYLTSSGRSKWLAWTSQLIEKDQLIYSVAKDITEKKEMEELLMRSNSLARIGSWEISVPENAVYWSQITREILNVNVDFLPEIKSPFGGFSSDRDARRMGMLIQRCIDTGVPWDEVLQVKTFSGQLKWIRNIGDSDVVNGQCVRLFGSLQDIDLQKRTELSEASVKADLEDSERRYSELFHLSPLPMWVYDYETLRFLDVNETALVKYGYSRSEFLEMSIWDIRPEEERGKLQKVIHQTRKSNYAIFQGAFLHKKKDGQNIHVDVKSNVMIFKGRKAKLIVANDISERIEYLNALEKRNESLREIAWIQSHKVRAPLAKLMGLVNMLSEKLSTDMEILKILDYLGQSANELDAIIREVSSKSDVLEK